MCTCMEWNTGLTLITYHILTGRLLYHQKVFKTLLPPPQDNEIMATYFSKLVARISVTHMPFFKMTFADVMDWHIPHYFHRKCQKCLLW